MQKSRYGNLLIDVATQIATASGQHDRWRVIDDTAHRLGANAVNGAAFAPDRLQPVWVRFGMDPTMVGEYLDANLSDVDIVLNAVLRGARQAVVSTTDAGPGVSSRPRDRQFRDLAERFQYNYACVSVVPDRGLLKLMVLTTERDPRALFGPGTDRAFRSITALLHGAMRGIGAEDTSKQTQSRRMTERFETHLSGPERDVLSLLAHGLSLSEIADRLVLTVDQVHVFVRLCCRKLGTRTGPDAVAEAMLRGLLAL